MCGLCGIFHYDQASRVESGILVAMRDTMVHRGPDGEGVWLDAGGVVGLAHRRLAILDLAESSRQPMSDQDGLVQVVFNGEIYNHLTLRRELAAAGYRFRTGHSDTEVLVNGYLAWGWEGLLSRLRGMFAFALWDAQKHLLWLARDRLGIKPLYFWIGAGRLVFASEIKAILKHGAVPRAVDVQAMYHYLSGMAAPAPLTLFEGIRKLPAGHWMRAARSEAPVVRRYWSAFAEHSGDLPKTRDEAVSRVQMLLKESVAEHAVADVPVGLFLSGGVDSSTLLAGLQQHSTARVHTFSVGYDDWPENDERAAARQTAAQFGAEHLEVAIGQRHLEDSWEEIVHHQDEPLADWVCLPLFHLAKLASGDVKVVLAGEGADEIFCGYESYIRYLRIYERLWQPYRQYTPGPVREAIAQAVEYISRRTLRYSGASDLLVRAARDRHLFWGGAMTFWETQKKSLLDLDLLTARLLEPGAGFPQTHRDLFDTHELIRDSAAGLPPQADELARMTKLELDYRLPELLLMRMDKMTMAHSVEARVPFLDHRLVELACALPAKWKISGGIAKLLLKDAVRGTIPDRAIDGRKKGFGAPISDWAKHELGFRMEKTIVECRLFKSGLFKIEYIQAMFREHRRGRQNFAARLWVLYNLASWYDRWIEPMPFSTGR